MCDAAAQQQQQREKEKGLLVKVSVDRDLCYSFRTTASQAGREILKSEVGRGFESHLHPEIHKKREIMKFSHV